MSSTGLKNIKINATSDLALIKCNPRSNNQCSRCSRFLNKEEIALLEKLKKGEKVGHLITICKVVADEFKADQDYK